MSTELERKFYQGQECWARWNGIVSVVGLMNSQRLVAVTGIDEEGIHVKTLDGDDGDQATAIFSLAGEMEDEQGFRVNLVPVYPCN